MLIIYRWDLSAISYGKTVWIARNEFLVRIILKWAEPRRIPRFVSPVLGLLPACPWRSQPGCDLADSGGLTCGWRNGQEVRDWKRDFLRRVEALLTARRTLWSHPLHQRTPLDLVPWWGCCRREQENVITCEGKMANWRTTRLKEWWFAGCLLVKHGKEMRWRLVYRGYDRVAGHG